MRRGPSVAFHCLVVLISAMLIAAPRFGVAGGLPPTPQGPIKTPPLLGATPLSLPNVTVAPMGTIQQYAGESQSVVIPPNANASCPNGRILIDNDYTILGAVESGMQGGTIVFGHDFDTSSPQTYPATFDPPWPNDPQKAPHRFHAQQDHQYVLLPGGKVLLVDVGQNDDPKHTVYPTGGPDWGPYAFKMGPDGYPVHKNDHTIMYVWRSDDCGQSFHWINEIDPGNDLNIEPGVRIPTAQSQLGGPKREIVGPATPGDGSCAMPQWQPTTWYAAADGSLNQKDSNGKPLLDSKGNLIPNTATTPNTTWAGYYIGGTDGPSAYYDARTGSIYVHYQCVGDDYKAITGQAFGLGGRLNRNRVYVSQDLGAHWYAAGQYSPAFWRGSFAPFGKNRLAFYGLGGGAALFATEATNGALSFDPNDPAGASAPFPPSSGWGVDDNAAQNACLYGNIESSWFVARGPRVNGDETILVTYPNKQVTLAQSQRSPHGPATINWGYGQDLLLYDPKTNGILQLPPVAPRSHSSQDFVVHLTAIDPGEGPILLYWLDVATALKTATVMGRFVENGGAVSPDFVISQTGGPGKQPAEYDQTLACPEQFFGDYRTAGGFAQRLPTSITFSYFPTWVEPSQSAIRFTSVVFTTPAPYLGPTQAGTTVARLGPVPSASAWIIAPARASLAEVARHPTHVVEDPERTEKPRERKRR
jgi:hypothetical protein